METRRWWKFIWLVHKHDRAKYSELRFLRCSLDLFIRHMMLPLVLHKPHRPWHCSGCPDHGWSSINLPETCLLQCPVPNNNIHLNTNKRSFTEIWVKVFIPNKQSRTNTIKCWRKKNYFYTLTLSKLKRVRMREMTLEISSEGRSCELLAPNENPPYL